MLPSKYLDLSTAETHSLDHAVDFIGLPARLTNFGYNNVRVKTAIHPGRKLQIALIIRDSLDAHKHVLLSVIEPMASTPCANNALQLFET